MIGTEAARGLSFGATSRLVPSVEAGDPHHLLELAVGALQTMGPTRTGKLLARKRSKLLPVYDSVVDVAIDPGEEWWEVIAAFFADGNRADALERVRSEAGAQEILTPLRTLDVILWMRYRGPIEG